MTFKKTQISKHPKHQNLKILKSPNSKSQNSKIPKILNYKNPNPNPNPNLPTQSTQQNPHSNSNQPPQSKPTNQYTPLSSSHSTISFILYHLIFIINSIITHIRLSISHTSPNTPNAQIPVQSNTNIKSKPTPKSRPLHNKFQPIIISQTKSKCPYCQTFAYILKRAITDNLSMSLTKDYSSGTALRYKYIHYCSNCFHNFTDVDLINLYNLYHVKDETL